MQNKQSPSRFFFGLFMSFWTYVFSKWKMTISFKNLKCETFRRNVANVCRCNIFIWVPLFADFVPSVWILCRFFTTHLFRNTCFLWKRFRFCWRCGPWFQHLWINIQCRKIKNKQKKLLREMLLFVVFYEISVILILWLCMKNLLM